MKKWNELVELLDGKRVDINVSAAEYHMSFEMVVELIDAVNQICSGNDEFGIKDIENMLFEETEDDVWYCVANGVEVTITIL